MDTELTAVARAALTVAVGLVAVAVLAGSPGALAQSPEGSIRQTETRLAVVGRDQSVRIDAILPSSCVGSEVTVALFQRGGAARVNDVEPLFEPVSVRVGAGGAVVGQLRLPGSLPSGLKTLWPGVTGSCLTSPVISTAPGLLFGVRDPSENPGASATFVVPRASLFQGRSEQVVSGSLTAFADGVKCTTVSLEGPGARDAEGNIRIHVGGPSQPAACSRQGARVTFRYPGGELLYETRELVLGVTQPFENLAPEAGPSTAGGTDPTALAPNAGPSASPASGDATGDRGRVLTRAGLIALGLGLTTMVLWRGLRRGPNAWPR
ncbi:MAG: hypothetical protein C0506_13090 [Anaerolinea sp.]|nr:hypothetical protein [Anaerolinea sp.]